MLRKRCFLLLAPLLLPFGAPRAFAQDEANPLNTPIAPTASVASGVAGTIRLDIEGEEPTGIYFDRDTIGTQSALVWTLRIENTGSQPRRVSLTWKVQDDTGSTILRRDANFEVAAGAFVRRRELFAAPRRGGYLFATQAVSKKDGPDDVVRASTPFSVVAMPTSGYRPDSFWSLDAPLDAPNTALDAYARIGARVLRSPFPLRTDESGSVDTQLRSRLERRLGTQGYWNVTAADAAAPDELRTTFEAALRRYAPVRLWEVVGTGAEGVESTLVDAAARVTPTVPVSPLVLPLHESAPLPIAALPSSDRPMNINAATLWPQAPSATRDDLSAASVYRVLQTRGQQARANVGALYVRRVGAGSNKTARDAANQLVEDYLLAIASGTRGLSLPLDDAADATGLSRMARGAAFAAMTKLLENALYEEDVYTTPLLWGSTFQTPQGAVAALWPAPGAEDAQLAIKLPDATVIDVFGDQIDTSKSGRLKFSLKGGPVYIQSSAAPTELAAALRKAELTGVTTLDAQLMPLTQRRAPRRTGVAANSEVLPPPLTLRVRLLNTGLTAREGLLKVRLPQSKVGGSLRFRLAPDEAKVYSFSIADLDPKQPLPGADAALTDRLLRVRILTQTSKGDDEWTQETPLETAPNVRSGQPIHVDGDLSEWRDAAWMKLPSNAPRRGGPQVALAWDAQNLYIAARVEEPSLVPRRFDEREYRFWQGRDALQLAFGLRDEAGLRPARTPFRDTDYGFLLSPFGVSPDGTVQGRILRLWNVTNAPYGTARDLVRYGGVVTGSRVMINRDPTGRFTYYEALIPLSEMPSLRPERRAKEDIPVRFSWVLHQDDAPALEWGRTANIFSYWRNPTSFLPVGVPYLPAQTSLGFTLEGAVDPGPPVVAVPVAPPVSTPRPLLPTPVRPAPVRPVPRNTVAPRETPPLRPMPLTPASPNSLPPASPPNTAPVNPEVPPFEVPPVEAE